MRDNVNRGLMRGINLFMEWCAELFGDADARDIYITLDF